MNKILWIGALWGALMMNSFAQHVCSDPNCASCKAAKDPVAEVHEAVVVHEAPAAHVEQKEHEEHEPVVGDVPQDACADLDGACTHHENKADSHEEHAEKDEHAEADAHSGCDHGGAGSEQKSADVVIEPATGGLVERIISFPAEIQVNRDCAAAVSPKYAGIVRKLYVEIGDPVKAGDLLATVESRDALANYPVTSPRAGTVVSRGKSVGEMADEATVLFDIVDLSTVWVEVNIFPQYRHVILKGQRVHLIASDGHTADTVIDYVNPLLHPETRTLKARCVMAWSGDDFTPGAFVRAQIAVESIPARVRLVKDAVQTMNGETIVFIQDEHGIEPRDVRVGLSGGGFVEIKSGLEPGEKVVVAGAFNLKAELVTSGLDPHAGHGH